MRYRRLGSQKPTVRPAAVAVAVAAALAGMAQPASAALTDPDPSQNPCITNSTFALTASRSSVVWGQAITLNTSVHTVGCTILPAAMSIQFIDPQSGMNYVEPVSAGQSTLIPPATGRYDLVVTNSAQVYHVASVGVTVSYPSVSGHPFARITPGVPDEAATFQQVVQQAGARVYLQGDVNLDLSGMKDIHIAPGVQIIGERDASHPHGPRLFTTTFPDRLLEIGDNAQHVDFNGSTVPSSTADNVRISGLVLDGGEPSDPCASAGDGVPGSYGIFVYSSKGVQVDHSELFHWRGAGVDVEDNDAGDNPGAPAHDATNQLSNSSGVWIYDNYIHDNMHPTSCDLTGTGLGLGYGVVVANGGFPYIQGNVFDDNRHAIAGTGRTGDGYIAIGNLFLNPGLNKDRDGLEVIYNHQIDMHGTVTCGDEGHDCGQGGLYQEVENNTVVGNMISAVSGFSDAAAIQLRGQPSNVLAGTGWPLTLPTNPGLVPGFGMYVHDNTFNGSEAGNLTTAATDPTDTFGLIHGPGNAFVPPGGMVSFANAFYNPSSQGPTCDFDGDGTADAFRDSAGTFWYYSSRLGRWTYLTTNNVPNTGLTFSDVNGDGLCDVSNASGTVYLSSPALFGSFPLSATVPPLAGDTQAAAEDAIAAAGLKLDAVNKVVSGSPTGTVIGQSLAANSTAKAGSLIALTVSIGGVAVGPPWRIAGTADMDGDGKADVLWYNTSNGYMQVWTMNGAGGISSRTNVMDENGTSIAVGPPWQITAAADMNGDGKADVLWYNTSNGYMQIWTMNGSGGITSRPNVFDSSLV